MAAVAVACVAAMGAGGAWALDASAFEPVVGNMGVSGASRYSSTYVPGSERAPQVDRDRTMDGLPALAGADIVLAGKVSMTSRRSAGMNVRSFKIFIPPGTSKLHSVGFSYLQNATEAIAIKMSEPPKALKSAIGSPGFKKLDAKSALKRVLAGEELTEDFNAQYGGAILISSDSGGAYSASAKGGWLYVDMLSAPEAPFMDLTWQVTVDAQCYKSWFAGAQFDAAGQPMDGVEHTCSGSGGGVAPVTPVTPQAGMATEATSATGSAILKLDFLPRPEDVASNVAGAPGIPLEMVFGARVPKEKLGAGAREDMWFMYQPLAYGLSYGETIPVQWDTGLAKAVLVEYGVELYFAYRTVDGGRPANPFLHPWKLGAYPGASALVWSAK